MKKITCLLTACIMSGYAYAHHGVASLGVAGLEGPGSPLETSSSITLPEGKFLAYLKLDYADFKKYTPQRDDETDSYTFWIYGVGYGIKSYLSVYLFVPYYTKKLEDNSFNSSGFADILFMGVLGFKYDEGFLLIPERESLDDLMDWHFTLYGGFSVPTGDPNIRDMNGSIDPGMSLGFGKPTVSIGATATKQLTDRLTFVADTNYMKFFKYRYADGTEYQFGDEFRFNTAFAYRILTDYTDRLRIDLSLEANFLNLGRDKENGKGLSATGGKMLYGLYGFRLYYRTISAGLGIKIPHWTDLNEESQQQGSEGKENYRLIFTFSALF
ncbi:MAG: transporter [Persephonella sp.]|nr:transporter [Persephonella sp.]